MSLSFFYFLLSYNPKNASGLFSFASTTLILSLYNTQVRGIHVANAVVGMACFCGGLAQLLAGMWEFPRGNTFGGTGEFAFDQQIPVPVDRGHDLISLR